jgi:hypothetical protein
MCVLSKQQVSQELLHATEENVWPDFIVGLAEGGLLTWYPR